MEGSRVKPFVDAEHVEVMAAWQEAERVVRLELVEAQRTLPLLRDPLR